MEHLFNISEGAGEVPVGHQEVFFVVVTSEIRVTKCLICSFMYVLF